jgi:hypothetical protein
MRTDAHQAQPDHPVPLAPMENMDQMVKRAPLDHQAPSQIGSTSQLPKAVSSAHQAPRDQTELLVLLVNPVARVPLEAKAQMANLAEPALLDLLDPLDPLELLVNPAPVETREATSKLEARDHPDPLEAADHQAHLVNLAAKAPLESLAHQAPAAHLAHLARMEKMAAREHQALLEPRDPTAQMPSTAHAHVVPRRPSRKAPDHLLDYTRMDIPLLSLLCKFSINVLGRSDQLISL